MNLAATLDDLESDDKARQERGFAAMVDSGRGVLGSLPEAMSRPLAHKSFHRIGLLMAALQARAALPALTDLLDRGTLSSHDRSLAARAMAELVDGRDVGHPQPSRIERAVLQLSQDPAPLTRRYAVDALQRIGSVVCVDRLRQLGNRDGDASVRQRATEAQAAFVDFSLATAPTTTTATVVAGDVPAGEQAIDFGALLAAQPAVAKDDRTPAQQLVDMLSTPRWADRQKVVDAVVNSGAKVGPLVVDKLVTGSAQAKLGACLVCARMQLPDAATPLMVLATMTPANDDERELPSIALKALANCLTGQELGLAGALLPLCKHRDPFIRAGALLCLGRLPERVAVKAAVIGLNDDHDHVQKAAAVALSEAVREEDGAVVPALLALWRRSAPMTAEANEAILIAFSRIHIEAPGVRVRVRHHARKLIFGQTASMRRGAIALLEVLFDDQDPPPVSVVDDIMNRLQDPHPDVRMVAASFLSKHMMAGMPTAAPTIRTVIAKQPDAPMAVVLLEALRRIDTDEAKSAVLGFANSSQLHSASQQWLVDWQPRASSWQDTTTPTSATAAPQLPPELPRRKTSSGPVVEAKDSIVPVAVATTVTGPATPAGIAAAASLRSFDAGAVMNQMIAVVMQARAVDDVGARAVLHSWQLDDAGLMRMVGVTSPGLSSSSAAAWAAVMAVAAALNDGVVTQHYDVKLSQRRNWVEQSSQLRADLADIDRQGLSPADALSRRAALLS